MDGDGVDLSLSLSIGGGSRKAAATAGEVRKSAPPSKSQAFEGEAQEMRSRAADGKVREGECFLRRKRRSVDTHEISKDAGAVAHFPGVRAAAKGVPSWAPAIAAADLSRQMPSSTASSNLQRNCFRVGVNRGEGRGVKAGSSSASSSPGSSASCVSVHCAGSIQGGSSDARSTSINAATERKRVVHLMEDEPVSDLASDTLQPVPRKLQAVPSENKSLLPSDNHTSSLPQMPCVSTTGKGPYGRTITGFLYRYDESEVSIVCVCHGTSFSPAGFVKHAGGTDISHPLKQIVVVVPS